MTQAPANVSWRDQMEIWFRVLQRKLLTPNHVAGVAALKQAIAACIAAHNCRLAPSPGVYQRRARNETRIALMIACT